MEHFVQFAISVDDNAIRERIENNVEREVIAKITNAIEDVIFNKNYYSGSVMNKEPLKNMVYGKIDEIITQEKDTIIEMAAQILADRLLRSKKGKSLLEQYEVQEDE